MGAKYLLSIIILIIISAAGGFLIGKTYQPNLPISLNSTQTKNGSLPPQVDNIFISQTATIQGKITAVSGNKISFVNDQNVSGQFTASPKLVIYKFAPGTTQSTATQDIKQLTANRPVTATLTLAGNQYEVSSVTYLPSTPPPPPPASAPASR